MSDRYPVWTDETSRHWVWLEWHDPDVVSEGGVSLSGQMLGTGEYEYSFLVRPTDLPALWAALGVPFGEDREALVLAVRSRFEEIRTVGDRKWLEQHEVPFAFWSRAED